MTEYDRLKRAILAIVRSAFPNIDYLARYPCKVIAQNADGSLELKPDDSRIPGQSHVPLRKPFPDMDITVQAGARCLLAYEGGDPSQPRAELWDSGSVTSIRIGGAALTLDGTTVNLGSPATEAIVKGTTWKTAEDTFGGAVIAAYTSALQAFTNTPPATVAQLVAVLTTLYQALAGAAPPGAFVARETARLTQLSTTSKTK